MKLRPVGTIFDEIDEDECGRVSIITFRVEEHVVNCYGQPCARLTPIRIVHADGTVVEQQV